MTCSIIRPHVGAPRFEVAGRRALVTGATGYLGSALSRRLLAEGWEVHALARATGVSAWRGERLDPGHVHPTGADPRAVSAVVGQLRPMAIFHVAAAGNIAHDFDDIPALIDANIALGTALAEAAAANGSALIAAGSYGEVGDGGHTAANSLYAATKRALDPELDYYAAMQGLCRTKLVLTDICEPGDWRNRLLSQLVAAARDGRPVDLTDGGQEMEPLHVDDAAVAFIHAAGLLSRETDVPPVASVGGGERLTLRSHAGRVEKAAGARIVANWDARPYPKGQIFSPVRLPALPSWQPRTISTRASPRCSPPGARRQQARTELERCFSQRQR